MLATQMGGCYQMCSSLRHTFLLRRISDANWLGELYSMGSPTTNEPGTRSIQGSLLISPSSLTNILTFLAKASNIYVYTSSLSLSNSRILDTYDVLSHRSGKTR